jgi:hypothetical protein
MHLIFLVLHNLLRWAVMVTAIWAIYQAVKGLVSRCPFGKADDRSNFFFVLSCDIQLLIGLVLYFAEGWWGKLMHWQIADKYSRFFTVEHAGTMLLAWVIVHIGRSVVKKGITDRQKHTKALIYFGVAFILILAAIPWPFRIPLGIHPWFRF